jgi:hypothetical protein
MKILIIICSHCLDLKWCDNIKILHNYMMSSKYNTIHYCGISNQDDFHNYEDIITFKYKIINTRQQLSKICDFITDYKSELDYNWYMKIRPDIKLLENINFDILSENAINARARLYNGPSKIMYGMSINGVGLWKNVGDYKYDDTEHDIILDDMLYIFHHNIIQNNGFEKIDQINVSNAARIGPGQHEWLHTEIFNTRKIPLNVIGIWCCNTKYDNATSGNTY